MDVFIAWCAFLGAWLLVAGPVYQAAVELGQQDRERRDVAQVVQDYEHGSPDGTPPPVSGWWWLLPPVLYVKHRQRDKVVRDLMMSQLTTEQTQLVVEYMHKASGWMLVGLGGLLIAAKETWELHERYEWQPWVFWLLVVVMAVLCLANAGFRMRRSQSIVERRRQQA
jgi:hypothetical protein